MKILIIDDEKDLLEIYHNILSQEGHSVMTFSNPNEALEVILKIPKEFDLIVSDFSMPTINGMELFYLLTEKLGLSFSTFIVHSFSDQSKIKSLIKNNCEPVAILKKEFSADYILNVIKDFSRCQK